MNSGCFGDRGGDGSRMRLPTGREDDDDRGELGGCGDSGEECVGVNCCCCWCIAALVGVLKVADSGWGDSIVCVLFCVFGFEVVGTVAYDGY